MAHLYADYYQKRFRVSCCSGVALIWLGFLFLALALPYYICQVTQGFFTKQVQFQEHAAVDFEGAVLVSFLDSNGYSQTFSNVKELNKMYEAQWKAGVPTIAIQQIHNPDTGKMTEFKLMIDLAGVNPQVVRRIQVLSTFKFKLRQILNLDMIGMLETAVETPNGAGKVTMNGELNFDQDEPILIDNVRRTIFNVDPLLNEYQTRSLPEIIENYQNRKEKLNYDYNYLVQPYASPHKTSIVVNVKIPTHQQIQYIPGALQTLKFAWVQYISLALPSMFIFYMLSGFIFRHQIVDSAVTSDLVARKRI